MKGLLIGIAGACCVATVVGLTTMVASSVVLVALVAGGGVALSVLITQHTIRIRVRRAVRGEVNPHATGIEAEVATPVREFAEQLQSAVRDGLVARRLAEEQAQEAQARWR